jgi:hypothetical protein
MPNYDNEDCYIPTLAEKLTTNFYAWERRGRGWQVFDYPVELEPPFEPFFHYLPYRPVIDDGRKKTFFGSLARLFTCESRKPSAPEHDNQEDFNESYAEIYPETFEDHSTLVETRISLPRNQKISPEVTEQFLLNLSYCALPLSLEIIGSSDFTSVQLTCRERDLHQVRQQLKAYFPDASLSEERDFLESLWDFGKETLVVDFGLSTEFMRPLRVFKNFEIDPLIGIIGSLDNLESGELGILQILFQAARQPWPESILRSVSGSDGRSFFADCPEMLKLAENKVRKPLFAAVIRIVGQSQWEDRALEIAKSLAGGLTQLADPHGNELIPLNNDDYDDYDHVQDVLLRQTRRIGMLLGSEELVSLVHPPSLSVRSEKLVREIKKTKPLPKSALGHRLILGENVHQGRIETVSLGIEQRLRHMHLIGATGTGKSTLLLNLIVQDIKYGQGLAVLDPHGDLIDQIIGHIPENRFQDVILFDPSDADWPVGFNILSASSDIEKNVLASDLVGLFRRFSTSWGDQMTSVLGNAVLAFLESERGGTLIDLKRFLVENDFRKTYLASVSDPEVIYYWQKEFPLLKGNPQASILTRLNSFLRVKLIRNIVAQRQGLNFEEILNGKKIFLGKLAQGLIGEENSYLLGALIVSKIQQVAMARQARSHSERQDFFLYIDEFHNFVTPSLASILSGARKYHLGLVLAHQELRQLWNRDTELANSVISNPGTRICFRLGDFDAQKLADGFSYFNAQDLQSLGTGEAVMRLERSEYDFNLRALPPPEVSLEQASRNHERLTLLSREKYAGQREELETSLIRETTTEIEIEEEVEPEPVRPALKVVKKTETPRRERPAPPVEEKLPVAVDLSETKTKSESQHRYLQTLIKHLAEDKGFKAVIEQPTPDGLGRVDVSLETESLRIACEISVSSTEDQEVKNIEKCLAAGYDAVLLCSPEKKPLEKVRKALGLKLDQFSQKKVFFLQPDELMFFLEEQAARLESKEQRVKGYKVKVQYQPVKEPDKKVKREAVAKVILRSMRRMKEDE